MAESAPPAVAPGTYRVAVKHIFRASIVSLQMGTTADGSPNIVQQPGPMERLPIGTDLAQVTPEELRAFGDRLAPLDAAARAAWLEAHAGTAATPPEVPPPAEGPAEPPPEPPPVEPPPSEPPAEPRDDDGPAAHSPRRRP